MPDKRNNHIIFGIMFMAAVFAVLFFFFSGEKNSKNQKENQSTAIDIPKSIRLRDEVINLEWTDDNEGEDLIIQSDKKSYFGIDRSEVYFSITNTNKKDQKIDLRFLFADKDANLEEIKRLEDDKEIVIARSDPSATPERGDGGQGSDTAISDKKSSEYYQDSIKSGQTNYYKAEIRYPTNSEGEFYIEAKGDNGAYGLLDPWYSSTGLVGRWSFDGEHIGGSESGNNLSLDPSAKSLYSFESGSFTDDSIGNNDLTNSGVATDTVYYKEGNASGDWESGDGDYMYVSNSNLDGGHPFKYGYAGKTFSVCAWFGAESFDGVNRRYIVNSYAIEANGRSFSMSIDTDNRLRISLGFDSGNDYVQIKHGTALSALRWYHACATYDDDTKLATIRIWDDTAQAIVGTDVSDSTSMVDKTWYSANVNLSIGAISSLNGSYFDGRLDEIVIFDDVLNNDEIDQIRRGNYRRGAIDSSGNGNNGTIYGASQTIGKVGQALSFDGNDYINFSGIDGFGDFIDNGEFTVSLWVKTNLENERQVILGDWNSVGESESFSIEFGGYLQDSSHITTHFRNTAVTYLDSNVVYGANTWYHIIVTKNSSGRSIYIDGDFKNSDSVSTLNSGTKMTLGRAGDYNSIYLDGSIDEVAIFNRALSEDEIEALYKLGKRKVQTNTSNVGYLTDGLVGHWTFDGPDMDWSATGAEVIDRSGQGNHGAVVSMDSSNAVIGKVGQALSFDGDDDYVEIGDELEWPGALTVSSWHKRSYNDAEYADGIVGNWYWSSNAESRRGWVQRYYLSNPDRILFAIELTDGINIEEKSIWYQTNGVGEWYHVVSTFNPEDRGVRLYVDGILRRTAYGSSGFDSIYFDSPNSLKIGYNPVNRGYFRGFIDEVRVYNRALSSDEIMTLYDMGNKKLKIRQ